MKASASGMPAGDFYSNAYCSLFNMLAGVLGVISSLSFGTMTVLRMRSFDARFNTPLLNKCLLCLITVLSACLFGFCLFSCDLSRPPALFNASSMYAILLLLSDFALVIHYHLNRQPVDSLPLDPDDSVARDAEISNIVSESIRKVRREIETSDADSGEESTILFSGTPPKKKTGRAPVEPGGPASAVGNRSQPDGAVLSPTGVLQAEVSARVQYLLEHNHDEGKGIRLAGTNAEDEKGGVVDYASRIVIEGNTIYVPFLPYSTQGIHRIDPIVHFAAYYKILGIPGLSVDAEKVDFERDLTYFSSTQLVSVSEYSQTVDTQYEVASSAI